MSSQPPGTAPLDFRAPVLAQAAAIRHDGDELDPRWDPPEHPSRWERIPRAARVALAALVVLALVAALALARGFERAPSTNIRVPAGSVQSLGPLEFAAIDAVAHKSGETWDVRLRGTCRNTTAQPIPKLDDLFDHALAVGSPDGSKANEPVPGEYFGTTQLGVDLYRQDLPPSDDPVPCLVNFTMEDGYLPQSQVKVAMGPVSLQDNGVLKAGNLSWVVTGDVFVTQVPLVVEP